MSFEKRWAAIASQAFTSDGTTDGRIIVASTLHFKVKQEVIIKNSSGPALSAELEVKEVLSPTTMYVGPAGSISLRSDISAFTVALGASVFANEQPRPAIPEKEYSRSVFEEEPTVALRTFLVDDFGNPYNSASPLPVLFSGSISVGAVEITEGGNTMTVNSDGSINVNIVSGSGSTPGLNTAYNEISSVASGSETTVITFTAPGPGGFRLFRVDVSGENIALFRLKVNGITEYSKRTFWGSLNTSFDFENFSNGLKLNSGDVLTITVLHQRPSTANFEATVMGLNL